MALNLGELTVQLSYVDQISKWSREFSSSLNTVEKRLNKFAETAQKAAVKAGVALGGLTLVTRKLIDAASDAVELQNVMEQAFGSMADEMNQWATETAQAVGRSDYQIRQFVGTTQALLAPMLENREAAAEMSKQVAQLAVDLGSFWNVADDDALQALKSGLIGETEPLRRFGVNLLESSLQLEAQRMGIKKNVQQMTEAEKVQLRWAAILRQTKDAQGDAIRTADSYANQVKRLQGNLHNLAEEVGSAVVPYANRFVHELNTLLSRFHDLDWQTKEQIVRIGALAAAVLGGVVAFGAIASGVAVAVKALGILSAVVGIATSPWLLLAGVVLVALAGMVGAWDKYGDEIGAKADAVWQKIKPIYDLLAESVAVAWQWTVEAAGDAYEWVRDVAIPLVGATVATAWQWTVTAAGEAYDWLRTHLPEAGAALATTWNWTVTAAGNGYEWVRDNGPKWINQTVNTNWKWAVEGYETVKSAAGQATAWVDKTVTTTWNWVTTGLDSVEAAVSNAGSWGDKTLTTAWDWTVSGIANLPDFFAQAKQWAGQEFTTAWTWILAPTTEVMRRWVDDLATTLDSAAQRVRDFTWPEMDELPAVRWKEQIESALKDYVPQMTISKAIAQIADIIPQYQDGTITLGEAVQKALTAEVSISLGALALLTLPLPWPLRLAIAAVTLVPAEYLSVQGIKELAQTIWDRVTTWFTGRSSLRDVMGTVAEHLEVPVDILGAISFAEGMPANRILGVTQMSETFRKQVDALTQELFGKVYEVSAPEFQVTAAALSMRNYWNKFAAQYAEAAGVAFGDATPELKRKFLEWVAQFWAPTKGVSAATANLNKNWAANAVEGLENWFKQTKLDAITVDVPFAFRLDQERLTAWARDLWVQIGSAFVGVFQSVDWSKLAWEKLPEETQKAFDKMGEAVKPLDKGLDKITDFTTGILVDWAMSFRVAPEISKAVESVGEAIGTAISNAIIGAITAALRLIPWALENSAAILASAVAMGYALGRDIAIPFAKGLFVGLMSKPGELVEAFQSWIGQALGLPEDASLLDALNPRLRQLQEEAKVLEDPKALAKQLAESLKGRELSITAPPTFWERLQDTLKGMLEAIIGTATGGGALLPMGFAEGGFTDRGAPNQPVGIVHAGEWVAPAWMLKRYPWLFGRLEDIRKRGYQQGGPVATSVPKVTTGNPQLDRQLVETTTWLSALEDSLGQITDTIVTGFKQLFGWLGDLLVGLAERLFPEQMASLREFWSGMQDTLDRLFGPLTPEEKGLVESATAAEPLAAVPEVPPTPRFTELVRQWISELPSAVKTGLAHLRNWGKGVLESARQLRDWRKTLGELDKAAGAMAIKLGEIAKQTASNISNRILEEMPILQDALQAYQAAGGGATGIAAALTAIISHSETFQNLMAVINPILQAFADALGKILEPLLPLVEIVSNVLSPAFELLGTILSAVFTPILQALFPVLKGLGLAVLYVSRALAWLYNAIANTVNKLLGWLGVHLNTIDLKQFDDAIKQLTETTWDSAMARAKEKKAIDSVTSALRNVPQGFKVALERFRAAIGEPLAGAQVAWSASAGGNVTVIIEGDVYGMDDFERRVQTAVASAQRRNSIGRFGLATGGAQ